MLIVSVTAVVALTVPLAKASKLPPLVPVMLCVTLPASMYTSSVGADTVALPLLDPAAIVITEPPLSVTSKAVPAGLLTLAV